jgi:hypothetical protein
VEVEDGNKRWMGLYYMRHVWSTSGVSSWGTSSLLRWHCKMYSICRTQTKRFTASFVRTLIAYNLSLYNRLTALQKKHIL